MKKITFAFCLLLSLPAIATEKADEDMNRVVTMMLVAKATGMCGVFSQMISFQDATKMPGGDEFIMRFLNTEAARLGQSLESFMARCPVVSETYNDSMRLLGYQQ